MLELQTHQLQIHTLYTHFPKEIIPLYQAQQLKMKRPTLTLAFTLDGTVSHSHGVPELAE